ncbi:MAG: HD-GYP domain-containing protein [Spirochaetota bacterium]
MTHTDKGREMDSFYTSRILLALEKDHSIGIISLLRGNGFIDIRPVHSENEMVSAMDSFKSDLLIMEKSFPFSEQLCTAFRKTNSDAAIIWITQDNYPLSKQLALDISTVLRHPYREEDLVKAVKKALGRKVDHEIGMQFFDALFGMQMCTHRDMHQRTFEHAIRTTKVYGGFLLYLIEQNALSLTSWNLKNCLMAALVHDIGKLLLLNGILYKEGRLTQFEYQQVKRHPWYSVTALLGGQDIAHYVHDGPLETVSGYNEKNLSEQVKRWVFSIIEGNDFAYDELHSFFGNMMQKPFIHSLNRDLLYIVFRHHDSIDRSYHSENDLELFSKIIDSPVSRDLDPESQIDIVTNALAISDVYDALMDKKRSYRKNPFNRSFALFLIYIEMKRKHFFHFLTEHFIRYIVAHELTAEENIFSVSNDPDETLKSIERLDKSFKIAPVQEADFNRFLVDRSDDIRILHTKEDGFIVSLNNDWIEYYQRSHTELLNQFYSRLHQENLVHKPITDLSSKEIRIFDMLFKFFYSFPSRIKQDRIISYFIDAVTVRSLNGDTRNRLTELIKEHNPSTITELNRLFVLKGFDRRDLFETFSEYDEDLLLTEFNQGIRHFHWSISF